MELTNGLDAFVITDRSSFSEKQVSRFISQVCISLVIAGKLRDGTMVLPTAKTMAQSSAAGDLPREKREKLP